MKQNEAIEEFVILSGKDEEYVKSLFMDFGNYNDDLKNYLEEKRNKIEGEVWNQSGNREKYIDSYFDDIESKKIEYEKLKRRGTYISMDQYRSIVHE